MEMNNFNNIKEFAENKTINKLIYSNMDYNSKKALKKYIYQILLEKPDKKDIMWEFLNEPIDSETYMYCSLMLSSYTRRKK